MDDAMLVHAAGPTENQTVADGPTYATLGTLGANGRKMSAAEARIIELVDRAPVMSPAQIARLRGILGGALARLDEAS